MIHKIMDRSVRLTILHMIAIIILVYLSFAKAGDSDPVDLTSLFGASPRRDLPFAQLVKYDGYNVTEYNVTTEDNYILGVKKVARNSSSPQSTVDKLPIVWLHGLYLTGDDCIIPGPGKGQCYIYSDAGYDVYVVNNRGNRYSRMHVTLNPDTQPEFWNFAFDDMAHKDLPAVIDFVLQLTGKTQVIIIGHSQGVTTAMLLCADKPEYNAKVSVVFATSTAGWLEHAPLPVLPVQGIAAIISFPSNETNNFEVFPHGGFVQSGVKYLCGLSTLQYPYCAVLVFVVFGYDKYQISAATLTVVVGHTPGGTSYKDFLRWGQVVNHGFVRPDLGPTENVKVYGSLTPPIIDLSNITTKFYFLVGENDYVGDPQDVKYLETRSNLKNGTFCKIPDSSFGHLDPIYSDNIRQYITTPILSVLETGNIGACIPV